MYKMGLREEIVALHPYEPPSYKAKIKMDMMENPFGFPRKIRERIKKIIDEMHFNRYPESSYRELREKLSEYLGIEPEWILLGNGSDELIQLLILCFDATIIYPTPTFSMYKIIATIVGRKSVEVPLNEGFSLNKEALIECAKKEAPSLIFLAYPNNPTGNCFCRKDIEDIIKREEFFIVVDEAYYEFCKKTFLPLVREYKNLAILRTFSKAFGLAGLRVGYLVTNPELVKTLNNARLPFNVDALSYAIATLVLEYKEFFEKQVQTIIKWRKYLYEESKKIEGVLPYPSDTNFLLMRFEKKSAEIVFKELLKRGIIVRALPIVDALRVTVGTPKECKMFLNALKEVMSI